MLHETITYRNVKRPINIIEGFITHRRIDFVCNDLELLIGLVADHAKRGYKIIGVITLIETGLWKAAVEGEFELLPNGKATNKIKRNSD